MLEVTATLLEEAVAALVVVEEIIHLLNKETTLEELGLMDKYLYTFIRNNNLAFK
jgi:hypothetical protein